MFKFHSKQISNADWHSLISFSPSYCILFGCYYRRFSGPNVIAAQGICQFRKKVTNHRNKSKQKRKKFSNPALLLQEESSLSKMSKMLCVYYTQTGMHVFSKPLELNTRYFWLVVHVTTCHILLQFDFKIAHAMLQYYVCFLQRKRQKIHLL